MWELKGTLPPADGRVNADFRGCEGALIPNPNNSVHAADLLELSNGDLLCAWFAGTEEGDSNVSIMLSRLPYGTRQWTQPVRVTEDETHSEQNPSLFQASASEIWLIYTAQLGREHVPAGLQKSLQATAEIRKKVSVDNGKTWSEPEILFDRPGSFCRQKIQKLSSGRWIFGNWICLADQTAYGSDVTVIQYSDDLGKTWTATEIPESRGRVHANILEVEPGKLTAFFRSRTADFIYVSHSDDGGSTWEKPVPTALPNNNASISAIVLKDGRIAIAYNHYAAPGATADQVCWPAVRSPVTVAISDDQGQTFGYARHVECAEGFCGEQNIGQNRCYEYPVIMQSKDGMLHLAYSYANRYCIRYRCFAPEFITGKVGGGQS